MVMQPSFLASADLSAKQYHFVKLTGNDWEVAAATANSLNVGVLDDKPNAVGKAAGVISNGYAQVYAGGTINAGDQLISDANGKVVAMSTQTNANICAIAVEDAVSGDLFWVKLVSYLNPNPQ